MEKIRFDDIDALKKHVSDEFGEFGEPLEVTQELINRFADLTGDHQWIHLDIERCKNESPFGTTIAHGFLTLSLIASLETKNNFEVVGFANEVNYGSDKLRFLSPVPANSKIHARSRLAAVEAGKKGTRVELEIAIHLVGSERPALLYSAIGLYQGATG